MNSTRLTRGLWLVVCLLAGAGRSGVTLDAQTPASPFVNYPENVSAAWIDDRDFVYGMRLLQFDLAQYLAQAAPHLQSRAEVISHWSGYYSISPQVLLTVMDMRSELLSAPGPAPDLTNPFRGLVADDGFDAQVQSVVRTLYEGFSAFRAAQQAGTQTTATLNAATYALLEVLRSGRPVDEFGPTVAALRDDFRARFTRLFPAPAAGGGTVFPLAGLPPANLLQLPWKTGVSWYFGGVHATDGGSGPMSSLDFSDGNSFWGSDTSNDFVVAAHDGIVTVFSSCNVRITSPSGWATNYYHIDQLRVANGQTVSRNQTIAVYANNLNQALCQGGSSSGPHVHFSLLFDGAFQSLLDVSLSGYVVHPGRFSYDDDPSYMWLQKGGTRYYANTFPIQSTPVDSAPAGFSKVSPGDNASRTGAQVTLAWESASGASFYEYCIDQNHNSNCDASWVSTGGSTSVTLTLSTTASYSWQARAVNSTGVTQANGGVWWRVPAMAPASFSKASPTDSSAGVNRFVTVAWAPSTAAASYEYCIDTSHDGSCGTSWVSVGASTVVTLSLQNAVSYSWQVRAVNSAGTTLSNSGSWWQFSTRGLAGYSSSLKAPECVRPSSACDSGSLLTGRGAILNGAEPNQPNTLFTSCPDGNSGVFHSDESVDRIRISSLSGGLLGPLQQIRIDVTIWSYANDFTNDKLDLYYAANASAPVWTPIGTFTPANGGASTITTTLTLSAGSRQAIRARLRYKDSAGACGAGSFTDHDDLVFAANGDEFDGSIGAANGTFIRASHIIELRQRINALRAARSVAAFAFSDPALGPGMFIRAFHFTELRTAVSSLYSSLGLAAPAYDGTIAAGQPVRAVHVNELRAAIVALE